MGRVAARTSDWRDGSVYATLHRAGRVPEEEAMEELVVERDEGVVWLRIDRPQKKNAMTVEMWRGLTQVFDDVAERSDDRVLVLTHDDDDRSAV